MTLADRLYEELKSRLERGVYASGARFPSESNLADEFSVNKMTMNKVVSRLAGDGYLLRGLRGAGTRVAKLSASPDGMIGYLGKLDSYDLHVLRGVIAEASRQNFMVLTESPQVDDLQYRLELLKGSGVSGIVSMGYGVPHLPDGMFLICVDYAQKSLDNGIQSLGYIDSDNFQGGLGMMDEIMRRGHREILIFSSERFVYSTQTPVTTRVRGFHQSMKSHGMDDFEQRTFYGAPDSLSDAKGFLRQYLQRYPGTTLIATDSDGSAELIYEAALELGVSCPGSIALTGFGNVTHLPIATVNQNPEHQGELAVRRLVDYIRTGAVPETMEELVDTEVVGQEYIPIL